MAVIRCTLIGYHQIFASFSFWKTCCKFLYVPRKVNFDFQLKIYIRVHCRSNQKNDCVCIWYFLFCGAISLCFSILLRNNCQFIKNVRQFLVMEGQNVGKFFWNNRLFYLGCKLHVRLNIFLNAYGYFKDLIHKVIYWTYL